MFFLLYTYSHCSFPAFLDYINLVHLVPISVSSLVCLSLRVPLIRCQFVVAPCAPSFLPVFPVVFLVHFCIFILWILPVFFKKDFGPCASYLCV